MVNKLIQALRNDANNSPFSQIIRQAIDLVSCSTIEREHLPNGPGQHSKSVADLYAFRKNAGYYNKEIQGLDETIDALRSADSLVWLSIIETNRGVVAIWRNENGVPLGIMIFKAKVELDKEFPGHNT